ncbi:uncharacterized protein LOC123561343 isoform X3 [Mercenaria mercenaria]|uniref:uncharacterized protein LOC123561343 isoform X3 n=1 Tax=Mercenaria mercenaria TaxID=6596 RepID=UPI00234E523E|nr:uncharacterized protein LOC123561343 isoform X3 [Mercenaria mercenaria]
MASKFSHLPDISTIQPDRLIKYRVSEDRFSAEVLLPGLSYTDFDQKIGGKVHLPSLAKICECVRSVAFTKGFTYFSERHRKTGVVVFVVCQLFSFTREAHYLRKWNNFGLNKPQRFLLHLSQAGKTSYTTNIDWFDSNNKKIGNFLTKHVAVDEKTRRPVALPEYFFKDIQSHFANIQTQTMEKVELPKIPSKAFCLNVKALYSDCDENDHVNQSIYLEWCSDVASEVAVNGHFSFFKKHTEFYPLKSMEMYYNGEGLLKDELAVNVWECETDNACLLFAIQKESSIIFHMKMTFYKDEQDTSTSGVTSKM